MRNCDGATGHPACQVWGIWAAVTTVTESLKGAGAGTVVGGGGGGGGGTVVVVGATVEVVVVATVVDDVVKVAPVADGAFAPDEHPAKARAAPNPVAIAR